MGLRAGAWLVCPLALAAAALLAHAALWRSEARSQWPATPGAPAAVTGPDGTYAVAVPGFSDGPGLAGDAVVYVVGDHGRERLFSVGRASSDGTVRTLYAAPSRRPGSAFSLVSSRTRIAFLRGPPGGQSCTVGGECSTSRSQLIGGPRGGRIRRQFGATERLKPHGSCRRRIAQLGADGSDDDVSVSNNRVAYARRVRCLSPRRRGRSQVVVRSLRTGGVRVVHRGAAQRVQLAGRYLAFEHPRSEVVSVVDLRSGRVVYRVPGGHSVWYSLGSDGRLAVARFAGRLTGRLGWYSPASPRFHELAQRVSVFSAAPLAYADGRIAYVRRFDGVSGDLAITDLRGRARTHVRVGPPAKLESFAFDGERLAFAHTAYRPDRGGGDDGLQSICVGDDILVQASATIVEVHPASEPRTIPPERLPSAAPYRSRFATRPECPYRH